MENLSEQNTQDGINKYHCSQCGLYFGPGLTSFKIKSKFKRRREGKRREISSKKRCVCVGSTNIQLKCLKCGKSKTIPLRELPCKKRNDANQSIKYLGTPNLPKKLFSDSPSLNSRFSTPRRSMLNLHKPMTPGSVNLPIINKPSKSAKKSFRMRAKTLVEMNKINRKDKEPDLFFFFIICMM